MCPCCMQRTKWDKSCIKIYLKMSDIHEALEVTRLTMSFALRLHEAGSLILRISSLSLALALLWIWVWSCSCWIHSWVLFSTTFLWCYTDTQLFEPAIRRPFSILISFSTTQSGSFTLFWSMKDIFGVHCYQKAASEEGSIFCITSSGVGKCKMTFGPYSQLISGQGSMLKQVGPYYCLTCRQANSIFLFTSMVFGHIR